MKPENKRETLIAREAFIAGSDWSGKSWYSAAEEAARRYPLPKITRPRVITFPDIHGEFAFLPNSNQIGWRARSGDIWQTPYFTLTPARLRGFMDLASNPMEEVEDDG